jgi:prepilin-type N-terminal cleavage/methylation domain-containing protein/prepilin-type processing-associated H-X9-DG protein
MKRSGFTLIELLVVIAIIAILAAILFPVFARARAKAQQNDCLSNIKEIDLGAIMYCSDNDDKWMYTGWCVAATTPCSNVTTGVWAIALFPYVKNTQIFICPVAGIYQTNPSYPLCTVGNTPYFQYLDYNYSANLNSSTPITTSSVVSPANCIAFHEGDRGDGPTNSSWGWGSWNYAIQGTRQQTNYDNCLIRHNNGCNYACVDGHVVWEPPGNIGNTPVLGGVAGAAGSFGIWFSPTS